MNSKSINRENERIFFLDNVRYLSVFLVVVFHVTCSYSHYSTWWAINDDNSIFFDYLFRFLNVFLMPTLFFIAGYFALPSLHRYGTWLFLKKKIIRLGIPWLVGVLLLGPIRIYIYEYSRGIEGLNLWKRFVVNFQEAAMFGTGFRNSYDQFNHVHLWFLSLLLFFFFVFALLHCGMPSRAGKLSPDKKTTDPSVKSIISVLVLVSMVTTILTLLMFLLFIKEPGKEPSLIIASILCFQPTRVWLYVICFALGIYTFHKNWFTNHKTIGNTLLWLVLTLSLLLAEEMTFASLMNKFSPILGMTYITIKSFLSFFIIITLTAFAGKYWNNSHKLNRLFAKNSYPIYLIHFVIVLSIQLLMYKWWDVSIYVKFVIGSVFSLMLSFILSEFLVRPYPKSSIMGMVSLFVVLILTLN